MKNKGTTASAMDIPEDIITLILVRLPVKSLLKFRCVCKVWCGLIGTHRFIDKHLQHPSERRGNEYLVLKRFDEDENTVLSFYCRDRDGHDLVKADTPDWRGFPPRMISIGGPINGIFLLGGDRDKEGLAHEHSLYLCNPATREFRKIPEHPFGIQRARPYKYIPPSLYEYKRVSVGFGYDPRTKEYKVISIMHFLEDKYDEDYLPSGPLTIEIYDLGSNYWRVVDVDFPTIITRPESGMEDHQYPSDLGYQHCLTWISCKFMCGVSFNGSIHWNALGFDKVILAFNISDEVMQAFHLPRGTSLVQSMYPRSLFVLDDSLAFVQRVMYEENYDAHTSSFNVWIMAKYGDEESWMKRYYLQPGISMNVLVSWDDVLICETEEGELASCNPKENAPHRLRKHNHIKRYVSEVRNKQNVNINMMASIVMNKESLVRLR